MPRKTPRRRLCVYCGKPCDGRACTEHRDLTPHDPHYFVGLSQSERREANAARRATGGASA